MADIKYNGLTALLKNDNTSNNVLFVSRKEDVSYREMFLQAISGVVSDISFWCLDRTECLENGAEREAFYDDLEHMKLVVVPVTTDFLFYANYAKDIVIPYCLKKHIPLLPVMMEPGLADDFNQICGDIQFFEYTQYDSTAISFEIKLANFLKGVLISEAHIKEIKDIFASYIFLSYRKKDRRDAQNVMQQIHNYANCEDVAIWYDEFLTPGENFNTSILEALKKSQLFALVVTPNLLEEENYVARIEYPEALKLGKAVLPVLAKPTDYMKLYEMFHLSQECIKEPQNLSGELTQLKGSDEGKFSAGKQFLLGLAYLNGIDVEIDYDRAIKLITASAEQNYEDAVRQMIFIYDNGFGTAQNSDKALEWALRYRDILSKKQLTDAKTVLEVVRNLLDLGDRYKASDDSVSYIQWYMQFVNTIIDVASKDFMSKNVFDLLELLYSLYMKLVHEENLFIYEGTAEIKALGEKLWKAASKLETVRGNADIEGIPARQEEFFSMCNNVVTDDLEGLNKNRAAFEKMLKNSNSDQYRRDLFTCHSCIIDCMKSKKADINAILEVFEQQQKLYESFIIITLEDKIMFARAVRRKGDLLCIAERKADAGKCYLEAAAALEEIIKGHDIRGAMQELFFAYQGLYDVTDEKEAPEKKKYYAEKEYTISSKLMDLTPCFNTYCMKADACSEMMFVSRQCDNNQEEITKYHSERNEILKKMGERKVSGKVKISAKTQQELFQEKAAQNAIRGVSYFLLIIGLVCTGAAVGLLIKSHVFGFIVLLLVGLFFIIGFWGNNKKSFYDEEAEKIHNQFLEGESSLRFLKRDLKL